MYKKSGKKLEREKEVVRKVVLAIYSFFVSIIATPPQVKTKVIVVLSGKFALVLLAKTPT